MSLAIARGASKAATNKSNFEHYGAIYNRYMPRVVGCLVERLGFFDLSGILHPAPNTTQYNWRSKGFFLAALYRYKKKGYADLLFACTNADTLVKIAGALA